MAFQGGSPETQPENSHDLCQKDQDLMSLDVPDGRSRRQGQDRAHQLHTEDQRGSDETFNPMRFLNKDGGTLAVRPTPSRSGNPAVTAAVYLTVDECARRFDQPPTGVYFNKILSVLHRQLSDVGVDIGLPHCWYRYGDEVVRYWLPSQLVWDHEAEDRTTVVWDGDAPEVLETKQAARLKTELGRVMEEFPPENLDTLVDYVYGYAPFEFQRSFRYFRERVGLSLYSDLDDTQAAQGILLPNLEKASEDFDRREFGDTRGQKEIQFETLRALLRSDGPDLRLIRDIAENFWFHYCYYLRLHPRAHENVPVQTKQVWMEDLEAQVPNLLGEFSDLLEQAVDHVPELADHEQVGQALASYREQREELDDLLRTTDPWFEGLDAFSREADSAYGG